MTTWNGRTCLVVDGKLLMSAKKQPGNFNTKANHPGGAKWCIVDNPLLDVKELRQLADGRLAVRTDVGWYTIAGDPHDGHEFIPQGRTL